MILGDTSVWIDHLRAADPALLELLNAGRVLAHPFVTGELACGNVQNRAAVLSLMQDLPAAPVASDEEVLALIRDAIELHLQGLQRDGSSVPAPSSFIELVHIDT